MVATVEGGVRERRRPRSLSFDQAIIDLGLQLQKRPSHASLVEKGIIKGIIQN